MIGVYLSPGEGLKDFYEKVPVSTKSTVLDVVKYLTNKAFGASDTSSYALYEVEYSTGKLYYVFFLFFKGNNEIMKSKCQFYDIIFESYWNVDQNIIFQLCWSIQNLYSCSFFFFLFFFIGATSTYVAVEDHAAQSDDDLMFLKGEIITLTKKISDTIWEVRFDFFFLYHFPITHKLITSSILYP